MSPPAMFGLRSSETTTMCRNGQRVPLRAPADSSAANERSSRVVDIGGRYVGLPFVHPIAQCQQA